MPGIVADVGGTNSRIAIATCNGVQEATIRRFANACFRSFYEVLKEYCRLEKVSQVQFCCVAVAGFVSEQKVCITNIDWEISAEKLKRQLSCNNVRILNDLVALGHSLTGLSPDKLLPGKLLIVSEGESDMRKNGQSLVIGIGTGFNVCPVKRLEDGRLLCFESEYGHTRLPDCILEMTPALGAENGNGFVTVEDFFSGRGLSRLHSILSGGPVFTGSKIIDKYVNHRSPDTEWILRQFAKALGVLVQDISMKFLPQDGIYFAGSVVRELVMAGFGPDILSAPEKIGKVEPEVVGLPIVVMADDYAALTGCHHYVLQQAGNFT